MERNETPNLDALAGRGVLAEALVPVFPTKTFPAHHSIVTGLYVENHGMISNRFYDPELGAYFRYGPPARLPEGDLWWEGEPIWVTAEKSALTAATLFWPGSDAEIAGVRPTRYLAYDGSMPNLARIDSVLAWLDPDGVVAADFATLYLSDIDSYGHRYGPDSAQLDAKVEEIDETIGYLLRGLEELGLSERTNLILLSDHGMAALEEEKVVFLDELVDLGRVHVTDWSPVALLRPAEGLKRELYEQLREREEGYRVYLREEMPDRFRFRNHRRIPEIVMIADLSWTITTRSFYERRGLLAGMHGYDHEEPEMQAFFLAAGPGFRVGAEAGVLQTVDLYELMCRLLGIEAAPNDGEPGRIKHLLAQ